MIDAGNFRHPLSRYFNFAHVGTPDTFVYGGKIILDGVTNILHRVLLRFSLGPATGKRWTIDRVTLVRLMKHDLISEAHSTTLHRERPNYSELYAGPISLARRSFDVAADFFAESLITDHRPT